MVNLVAEIRECRRRLDGLLSLCGSASSGWNTGHYALDVRFRGHDEKVGIAYADFGDGVLADRHRRAGDGCIRRPRKNGSVG